MMQLVTHSLVLCAAPRRRAPSPPPAQKKQKKQAAPPPACRRIAFGSPPRGAQGGEQHARGAVLSAGSNNSTGPAGIATKGGIFDAAEPLAEDSLGAFLLSQLRDGVRAARKARRKALRQARRASRRCFVFQVTCN